MRFTTGQRIVGSNNSTIIVGKVFNYIKSFPTHIGRGLFGARPIVKKTVSR